MRHRLMPVHQIPALYNLPIDNNKKFVFITKNGQARLTCAKEALTSSMHSAFHITSTVSLPDLRGRELHRCDERVLQLAV